MLQRKLLAPICFALTLVGATAAKADNVVAVSTCGGETLIAGNTFILSQDLTGKLCVNATVSASVSGFTPGNTFATLTATGSSASVALPAGTTVAIQNTGTTTVSCTLGIGSATALASEIQVPASSSVFVTPGANTFGACIDQTGSVSNLVVLAGGSGLGTGFGGGGGGSGGSSAITTWGGATLGAATAWGSAPTGNVNGVNANVLTSVLPTGAATSANQSTEITSLGTIATNSGTQATAANQAAGNASLATIATNSSAPLPGQANLNVNIGAISGVPNVTPTDCSGTVTTGGTAQSPISASATLHGFTIANVDASAGSGEPIWISFTGTASAANGSFPLAPPTATTFAAFGSYTTPVGFGTNHAVSIFAATTGHKFSCTSW